MTDPAKVTDAAPEHAPDLWERLVAGQITEVFTFSTRGLVFDLPQTLGLEPISYDAYIYDRDGVHRGPEELDRIAGELAAQQRWICNAGPLFWARHFAARAEAVLVFPDAGAAPDFRLGDLTAAVYGSVFRTLRTVRDRRRDRRTGGGAAAAAGMQTSDEPSFVRLEDLAPNGPAPTYSSRLVNFLVSEFPEKTFLLEFAEDVQALQTVRALPRAE